MDDLDFNQFIWNVKRKTGIDLSLYKRQQMKRRLTTLRKKRGYDTFAAFYDAMLADRMLYAEFLDRMTINVSEFWRNPTRWEVLYDRLLPELAKRTHRLTCWSAACATGEEPYSLAMILDQLRLLPQAEIIASDLDAGVLAKAHEGIYNERAIRDLPHTFIRTYTQQKDSLIHIQKKIKQAVRFEKLNLLADSFRSNYFDLIICRNVLIYFTDEAKELIYRKFADSLKQGGLLFVGSTEQMFSPERYGFETADTFFYRKL